MIEEIINKTESGELKWELYFPKGYIAKTKNAIITLYNDNLTIEIDGKHETQFLDGRLAQNLQFAIKDQFDKPKTLWEQIEW